MEQKERKEALGWILARKCKPSILSLDIDKQSLKMVEHFVRELQAYEDVGTAVIVESSDLHFHVYFFWRFIEWEKVQEIIQNSAIVDKQFKDFTKYNGWVRMRISNLYKPFLKVVPYQNEFNLDIGDFYFKHYLWLVGFAPETIQHYLEEAKL